MLSEMTGWVRLSDLASSFLKLHRLPGGPWLGSIMLFASVFALVADLAVNVLVLNKSVVKRCEFDQGLVIQVPLPGASQWGSPPPLGYPALIASNAQWNSFTNDGLVGIYRKANSDVNFMAQPEDVMGFWQCSNPTNETYDSSWDADSIGADLQNKGLLYDVGTPSHNMDSNNLGQSTHIIIWGASIEDGQKGAFKVKAAVQLGGDYASDKYMMAFDCSAYSNNYLSGDSDNINTIMSYMVANETIFQWAGSLQTTIYDGAGTTANPDTGFFLAMTLNTIIMVEGGGDVVDSYPTADSGFDQGCFVYTTWVSPFIFALLGLAALALISMIAYFLILILRLGIGLRFFSRGKQSTASINSLPDSLFGVSITTSFLSSISQLTVYSGCFTQHVNQRTANSMVGQSTWR